MLDAYVFSELLRLLVWGILSLLEGLLSLKVGLCTLNKIPLLATPSFGKPLFLHLHWMTQHLHISVPILYFGLQAI